MMTLALPTLALPTLLTIGSTIVFLILERVLPGRALPNAKGWYFRAALINLCQLGITLATNKFWNEAFAGVSLFHLSIFKIPALEGFVVWFVGSFFFYWWHRLRHVNGFWQVFHQIHHSPTRLEAFTSFYKHPLEILFDSALSALILYPLLGCSLEGAFWFNFYAATGEYFYHANFKSPKWLKYFVQTPELHSVHHQLDLHKYNYADIPLWDRMFGTYKDTDTFSEACGFPNHNERKINSNAPV